MAEKANKKYKDSVFVDLFYADESAEANEISLYNALHEEPLPEGTEIRKIRVENVLYMNFKNDISFLLDSELNLYEHQGSYNPNMPLRDLVYIAKQLEKYTRDETIYSSTLVKIPVPRFVVFYNGTDGQPERQILWLSDAFEKGLDEFS